MTKITKLFCMLLISLTSICNTALAQLDLKKKENLKDLEGKTLYVVIDNNSIESLALKEAVEKNWILSNYTFIDGEKYDNLKSDPNDYFLVKTEGKFKKEREPGIEFLSLVKGGGTNENGGINESSDIISLPMQSIDDSDGTIIPYLGAYVKIIQDYVQRVQKKKISAHIGLSWYSNRLKEIKTKNVLISENDLSDILVDEDISDILVPQVKIVYEDEVDNALENKRPQTLISLSIAPKNPLAGSYCYKMLISTNTNELFYYKKQKITTKNPQGFLKDDIKAIVYPFK